MMLNSSHLKHKVLATLQSRGLIHLAKLLVPHRNEEDRTAALKAAAIMNERRERKAKEQRLPAPEPLKARDLTAVYVWKLGPAPDKTPREREADQESIEHPQFR
jgi:hypothetical protein